MKFRLPFISRKSYEDLEVLNSVQREAFEKLRAEIIDLRGQLESERKIKEFLNEKLDKRLSGESSSTSQVNLVEPSQKEVISVTSVLGSDYLNGWSEEAVRKYLSDRISDQISGGHFINFSTYTSKLDGKQMIKATLYVLKGESDSDSSNL